MNVQERPVVQKKFAAEALSTCTKFNFVSPEMLRVERQRHVDHDTPSSPLRFFNFPLGIWRDVQVGPWPGAIDQEGDEKDSGNDQIKQNSFHPSVPPPS